MIQFVKERFEMLHSLTGYKSPTPDQSANAYNVLHFQYIFIFDKKKQIINQ